MMKKLIMVLCILLLLWFEVVSADEIDLDTTIWQVTHGKLGAGGEKYLVLGGFDHHVFVMNRQGKVLARRDVEGIPIRIVTADIHGNVGEEIVAAVLDRKGSIRALDARLNPLSPATISSPGNWFTSPTARAPIEEPSERTFFHRSLPLLSRA